MELAIIALLLIGSTMAILPNGNNNNNNDRRNNFQLGQIGTTTIMNSGTVNANFRFGQIVTQDYVYSDPAGNDIAAIVVTDLRQRKGASAAVISGGVGEKAVTIRFTSQRGFGINSRVEIYG